MNEFIKHIRKCFTYDDDTGFLLWAVSPSSNVSVGDIAGYVSARGRHDAYERRIKIKGKAYKASRVVWMYKNKKEIPKGMQIDHINGDTLNNRIENLRLVTPEQNSRNNKRFCTNTTGFTGVYENKKRKKWLASIHVGGGKQKYLGIFSTKAEAIAARSAGERILGYTVRER